MIDRLRKLLESSFGSAADSARTLPRDDVELATASLLVEMARSDFQEDPEEHELIAELLGARFGLEPSAVRELIDRAEQRADHAVSLQEFTRLLHTQLDPQQKFAIVEMLWRVSLADGRIDKHEEHLVRKVAGLLYVSDSDFVRARLMAEAASAAARNEEGGSN